MQECRSGGRLAGNAAVVVVSSGLFYQSQRVVRYVRAVVAMPPLAGAPGAAGSGQELTVPPGRSWHAMLMKITEEQSVPEPFFTHF